MDVYLDHVFDSILHVAHDVRDGLDVEPGVFEPVDGGLGQVEGVVGVGDGVQGDDEPEAVPGRAGDNDALADTGQLQPHPLLHGRDVDNLVSVQLDQVRTTPSHRKEAFFIQMTRVFHPQPMIFSHNLLEFQTFLFEQFEMFIKTIIIIKIFKIFFRQVPAISV